MKKFKNRYNINPEYEKLFTFSKWGEVKHELKMFPFRFLSLLKRIKKFLNETKF